MHEHLCSTSPGFWQAWPGLFGGREAYVEKCVGILKQAKQEGVETFVDVTTFDLGRDIRLIREVAEKSGVNIIACTGHWIDPSRSMNARSVEELTEFFTMEIQQGIEGTDIKAGIIKVANDEPGVTEFGEKVLRAAARTHKTTGVPITTHSHAKLRLGEPAAKIFEEEGVEPSRVTIGHSDDTDSMGYLTGLLKRGYWLDMDRLPFGVFFPPTFEERVGVITELVRQGYADQIMLSHDFPLDLGLAPTARRQAFQAANPDNILFITRKFLPALREKRVTDEVIRTMTVDNPRRFFDGQVSQREAVAAGEERVGVG
jgi:phosphotriesterase-related protein